MRRTPPLSFRLLAAAVVAVGLLLGPGAGAASAHDSLVGSSPAMDAAVPDPPGAVSLEFSRPPQVLGARVMVSGEDGAPAATGAAELSGTTVVQPLAADLPAGRYTVDWRVTSADGHPLAGAFAFTVTGGAPVGTASAADAVGTTAARSDDASFPWIWVAVGAVIAVAGAVVARQLREPA